MVNKPSSISWDSTGDPAFLVSSVEHAPIAMDTVAIALSIHGLPERLGQAPSRPNGCAHVAGKMDRHGDCLRFWAGACACTERQAELRLAGSRPVKPGQ